MARDRPEPSALGVYIDIILLITPSMICKHYAKPYRELPKPSIMTCNTVQPCLYLVHVVLMLGTWSAYNRYM